MQVNLQPDESSLWSVDEEVEWKFRQVQAGTAGRTRLSGKTSKDIEGVTPAL